MTSDNMIVDNLCIQQSTTTHMFMYKLDKRWFMASNVLNAPGNRRDGMYKILFREKSEKNT